MSRNIIQVYGIVGMNGRLNVNCRNIIQVYGIVGMNGRLNVNSACWKCVEGSGDILL
jgi:hypothetical protein